MSTDHHASFPAEQPDHGTQHVATSMQEPISATYTSERIFEDDAASELCGSPRLKKATASLKITTDQSSVAESHEGPFLNLIEGDTHCPDPRLLSGSELANSENQPPPYDAPQSTNQPEHVNFLRSGVGEIVEYVENIQIHAAGNIGRVLEDLENLYGQQIELSARRDFLRAAILRLELRPRMEDMLNGSSESIGVDRLTGPLLTPGSVSPQSSESGTDSQEGLQPAREAL